MSSLRNSSSGSNNGTKPSSVSQKKPSLPIRFIKWTAFQMISFIFAILLLGVGYAAWTSLSPSQGASGQPVNQTLMQGMINNINDLNTRLAAVEAAQVSNLGSGSLCGNSDWGAGAGNGIKCKGIAPIDGCPTGYTQGQFPIRAGGGIYGWAYTCVKN